MSILDKINVIDSQIKVMKNKLGLSPSASLEEVVASTNSGGVPAKSNVYRVNTLEKRDLIEDMVEGDMCVVISGGLTNMTVNDKPTALSFPSTVVLPNAFTESGWLSLRSSDYSVDVMIMLESTMFRCDIMGDDYISIEYTSSDGITYTRTDTNSENIDLGIEVSCPYVEEWNDVFGYFLQVDGTEFNGLFTYNGTSWEYSNVGLKIDENNVMYGTSVYGDNGVCEGVLGSENADAEKTLSRIVQLNDSVSKIKFTGSLLDSFKSVISSGTAFEMPVGAKSLRLPEIDCSEVTNITTTDMSSYNFTRHTDTHSYKKINIVSCDGFKNLGAGFVDSDVDGKNIIPQGLLQFLDEASLIKLFKGLAPVSTSKGAGIALLRPIYDLMVANDLVDEVLAKGWKLYVPAYSEFTEFTDLDGTTITEAQNYINNKSGTRGWLSGTNLNSDVVNGTITITASSVGSMLENDAMNEYYPNIHIHLNNSAPYPSYSAHYTFRRCIALKKIGGITFTSDHPTYNKLSQASKMYCDCHKLEELPMVDLSTVSTVSSMCQSCFSLKKFPAYNLASATSADCMFRYCRSLIDISKLSLPVAQSCAMLLEGCESLADIPSTFSLPKATNINYALRGCKSLTGTSIYNFLNGVNVSNITGSKKLSMIGITVEQWATLTENQQSTIISKGYENDFV